MCMWPAGRARRPGHGVPALPLHTADPALAAVWLLRRGRVQPPPPRPGRQMQCSFSVTVRYGTTTDVYRLWRAVQDRGGNDQVGHRGGAHGGRSGHSL